MRLSIKYLDFLSREPDGPGWDFWTDNITRCSDPARRPASQTEAQCIDRQRETTSAAFFVSPEFQNTGYFVLRVFRGSLNRMPFFGGSVPADNAKDEFTRDAARVSAGIAVNNSLSAAVINANKQAFVNEFVTRPEFKGSGRGRKEARRKEGQALKEIAARFNRVSENESDGVNFASNKDPVFSRSGIMDQS